jgi:hypothetical protein
MQFWWVIDGYSGTTAAGTTLNKLEPFMKAWTWALRERLRVTGTATHQSAVAPKSPSRPFAAPLPNAIRNTQSQCADRGGGVNCSAGGKRTSVHDKEILDVV